MEGKGEKKVERSLPKEIYWRASHNPRNGTAFFFHRSNKKCPQSMKDEIKNFRGEIGKPCASSYSNRYRASRFKWWWGRRRRICVLIGVSLSNHQGTRHFTHFWTNSLESQLWGEWQDLSPLFKFNLGFLRVMTFSEILLRGETNLHKYVLSNLW